MAAYILPITCRLLPPPPLLATSRLQSSCVPEKQQNYKYMTLLVYQRIIRKSHSLLVQQVQKY